MKKIIFIFVLGVMGAPFFGVQAMDKPKICGDARKEYNDCIKQYKAPTDKEKDACENAVLGTFMDIDRMYLGQYYDDAYAELECDQKKGRQQELCIQQARQKASQKKLDEKLAAVQDPVLSDTEKDTEIEKNITNEQTRQSNVDVTDGSGNNIPVLKAYKDAWASITPSDYTNTIAIVEYKKGATEGNYSTSNKQIKIEKGGDTIESVKEAMKKNNNSIKIIEDSINVANDAVGDSTDKGAFKDNTTTKLKEKDLIKAREKLKAQKVAMEIVNSSLQNKLNEVYIDIAKYEGGCNREVERTQGDLVLVALGEETHSYNITDRLSVGQENKLTLFDSNEQTGEKSIIDKVIRLLAQITGTLAVLLLITGAVLMIASRGSDSLLTMGKNMVIYTLGGVVIVFLSYILVQFIISFLFTIG